MNLKKIYERLKITPETLANFCQENQIKELAVFGSILRDDFNESRITIIGEATKRLSQEFRRKHSSIP